MPGPYNIINASLEEYTETGRGRAVCARIPIAVGAKVIQDEQTLLSIDTGVPFGAWSHNTGGVQTAWYMQQQTLADLGSQQLSVSIARNQIPPAQQLIFRALYRSNAAGQSQFQNDHNTLMRNSFSGSGQGNVNNQPTGFLRVYEHISRINHSCRPNAVLSVDNVTGNTDIITIRSLQQDEELTVDYLVIDSIGTFRQRNTILRRSWGFSCTCVDCHVNTRDEGNDIRQSIRKGRARWLVLNAPANAVANWDVMRRMEAIKILTQEVIPTEILVGKSEMWIDV
jgi:hypothetical protein